MPGAALLPLRRRDAARRSAWSWWSTTPQWADRRVARRPDLRRPPSARRSSGPRRDLPVRRASTSLPPGLVRLADADGGGVRIELTGLDRRGSGGAGRRPRSASPCRSTPRIACTRTPAGNPLHVTGPAAGAARRGARRRPPRSRRRASYARLVISAAGLLRRGRPPPDGRALGARAAVDAPGRGDASAPRWAIRSAPSTRSSPPVWPSSPIDPGMRALTVAHPLVRAAILDDLARRRTWRPSTGPPADALLGAAGLRHRIAGTAGHDPALAAEARAAAEQVRGVGRRPATAARLLLEARGRRARRRPSRPRPADRRRPSCSAGEPGGGHRAATAWPPCRPGPARPRPRSPALRRRPPAGRSRRHLEQAWAALAEARPIADDAELAGRVAGLLATIAVDRADGDAALGRGPRGPAAWPARCRRRIHVGPHAGHEPRPAGHDRRRASSELTDALAGHRPAPAGTRRVDLLPRPRRPAAVGARPRRGGRRPGARASVGGRWRHARRARDRPLLSSPSCTTGPGRWDAARRRPPRWRRRSPTPPTRPGSPRFRTPVAVSPAGRRAASGPAPRRTWRRLRSRPPSTAGGAAARLWGGARRRPPRRGARRRRPPSSPSANVLRGEGSAPRLRRGHRPVAGDLRRGAGRRGPDRRRGGGGRRGSPTTSAPRASRAVRVDLAPGPSVVLAVPRGGDLDQRASSSAARTLAEPDDPRGRRSRGPASSWSPAPASGARRGEAERAVALLERRPPAASTALGAEPVASRGPSASSRGRATPSRPSRRRPPRRSPPTRRPWPTSWPTGAPTARPRPSSSSASRPSSTTCSRAYAKLGVRSRTELARTRAATAPCRRLTAAVAS